MSDERAEKEAYGARRDWLEDQASWFDDNYEHLAAKCESPIELLFLARALRYMLDDPYYLIHPQQQIGPYRVDFLLEFRPPVLPEPVRVVVECDGHDFHERTKQQASRDKKRDRYLQAHGYVVMRFSGSDIWKDPAGCVEEVIDFTQQRLG